MKLDENEEKLLRSVALQNARAVLLARERAERELRDPSGGALSPCRGREGQGGFRDILSTPELLVPYSRPSRGGVGLGGIRERLRQLGGTLEITSKGGGTLVSATLEANEDQEARTTA
jgi:hypothetical protein